MTIVLQNPYGPAVAPSTCSAAELSTYTSMYVPWLRPPGKPAFTEGFLSACWLQVL